MAYRGGNPDVDIDPCPCGKKPYLSYDGAIRAVKHFKKRRRGAYRYDGMGFEIFRCRYGKRPWHLGNSNERSLRKAMKVGIS